MGLEMDSQEFEIQFKEFERNQAAFQSREATDRERVQGLAFDLHLRLVSTQRGL
jgi:hypothetical protein